MRFLALFVVLVSVVFSVVPIGAQTLFLRAEYIRLGDRLMAVDTPLEWTDNFNRTSLGSNWVLDTPFGTPFNVRVELETNQMKWFGWPAQITQTPGAAIPQPVLLVDGQPQWAQLKFANFAPSTDPHTYIGPAVLFKGALGGPTPTARGYFVQLTLEDAQGATWGLSLRRLDQPGNTATPLGSFVLGLAFNDTIRIEVVPSAAQNVIRGYRNGNPVFNYTDTDPNRVPTQGWPAVYCHGIRAWTGPIPNIDIIYLDDFSAGLL